MRINIRFYSLKKTLPSVFVIAFSFLNIVDVTAQSINWHEQAEPKKKLDLSYQEIEQILTYIPAAQRLEVLKDTDSLKQFIVAEAANLAVYTAALDSKINQSEKLNFLFQRSKERLIRETYLRGLIAQNKPENFPTDEAVEGFYNKNRELFVIDDYVHLSQIFLPVEDSKNKKLSSEVKQQANKLYQQLVSEKLSFAEAARKYSKHIGSRFKDGYLGPIEISNLAPEVAKLIQKLPSGGFSEPLLLDQGYYIYQRGTLISNSKDNIKFLEIKDEVKRVLIAEVEKKILQNVLATIEQEYPVSGYSDDEISKWRAELVSELAAESP